MPRQSQDEIRSGITNSIIESLQKGVAPWRKPWALDPNCGMPANIKNKKRYSGINPLILELASLEKGYKSRWWGTYGQLNELGGQVRKGEKATSIVFWKVLDVDDPKSVDGKKKKIFFLRTYNVFNLEQADGDKLAKFRVDETPAPANPVLDWEPAKKVIDATGATIRFGGNRACYFRPSPEGTFPNHTGGDNIMCPKQTQFLDPSEYYCTLFHELAHWSEVRMGWKGTYEMGELVAEITACYLAAETRIPNNSLENHEKYVASWLKHMQDDPKWIFQASTQASKACDFLLNFSQPASKSEDDEDSDDGEAVEQAA